jgi:hypothetical protein
MKRIQRKRTKGWKMPPNAVYVGRPTKFGNPWTVKAALDSNIFKPEACPQVVATEFEEWLRGTYSRNSEHLGIWNQLFDRREKLMAGLKELRGKDLACWCPLDKPCHADVLLRLANESEDE